MDSVTSDSVSDVRLRASAPDWNERGTGFAICLCALLLACTIVLAVTSAAWGQEGYEDEQINREGLKQIDRINHALEQAGKIFAVVGLALLAIVVLKIISPARLYDNARERRLRKAVRGVDDLLQRIQKEAEAVPSEPKEETPEEGVLAGMLEVAEFSEAEQVPSYVLTVNDLMLDNIRTTLKKLRRFTAGDAERYREYLFSVITGIKTLTEQSAEGGIASGLAVDVEEYFRDDKRYRTWNKLLSRFARRGKYQEPAHAFLLFARNLREGKSPTNPRPVADPGEDTAVLRAEESPDIPDALNEETLPQVQQAARAEAESLCSLVQTGKPSNKAHAWQFEFVRRQQRLHFRDEAERMFRVFLSCERKTLQEITRMKMLPCRTWRHVLHMLGVQSSEQLLRRIEGRFLTIQEIIILEKAFLQTFAKRGSLEHVYGHGQDAGLMIDMHIPEMRRESLSLLRKSHQTDRKRFERATEELDEEETPEHHEVRRLIEHYVQHKHDLPETGPQSQEPSSP